MHAKDLYERLSTGYNYDPMYGELCNERDRLKKENKKLRVENTKLRKLCKKLYGFAWFEQPHGTELNFAEDMKELGIEVKEWD